MSTTRIDIPVTGNFPPIRASLSSRNGVDGVLICQGDRWIWADIESFDHTVDLIDAMVENDEAELGRLGRLFQYQLPPLTTPAKRGR